jgi:hypothetical protein
MGKIKYLAIFTLLFLTQCVGTNVGTNSEQYKQFQNKNLYTYSFFSMSCPVSDPMGNNKLCYYAAADTQSLANKTAVEGCSTVEIDCVVVKENDIWVFSNERYQLQANRKKMDKYIEQCEYIGFKRNTDKLGECVLKISQTEKQLVDIQVNNSGGGSDNVANLILLQESLKLLNPPRATNNNVRCTFNNVGGIGAVNCF